MTDRTNKTMNTEQFPALYSETLSRPNTPVNILAGIEILKAGYGWSDEESYKATPPPSVI